MRININYEIEFVLVESGASLMSKFVYAGSLRFQFYKQLIFYSGYIIDV